MVYIDISDRGITNVCVKFSIFKKARDQPIKYSLNSVILLRSTYETCRQVKPKCFLDTHATGAANDIRIKEDESTDTLLFHVFVIGKTVFRQVSTQTDRQVVCLHHNGLTNHVI